MKAISTGRMQPSPGCRSTGTTTTPSGTGKSTVCRELRARDPELRYSVSCTTRPPRPGERNGRHYRFLTPSAFGRLRAAGGLLEWARVHGACYGTPRRFVEERIRAGEVILADMSDFAAMNEAYRPFFEKDFPARATVQVVKLPAGARVEIDAVAVEAT